MKTHVSPRRAGFTLVELLTVMAIIAILVGLVLGTAGYVQKAAARKQAGAEIKAYEAVLESYKAENGVYPQPRTNADFDKALYQAITGDGNDQFVEPTNSDGTTNANKVDPDGVPGPGKVYYAPKKDQYSTNGSNAFTLTDPFGNSYHYRPGYASNANNTATFDLWSTAGATTNTNDAVKWQKNW